MDTLLLGGVLMVVMLVFGGISLCKIAHEYQAPEPEHKD